MIGIAIPFYERYNYAERMLSYIKHTDIQGIHVVFCLVDDGSQEEKIKQLIRDFYIEGVPIIKVMKPENKGIFDSLRTGWDLLEHHGCTYLCNIDSDTIVKAKWLKTVWHTYEKTAHEGARIVTGYNSSFHSIERRHEDYCIKKSIGGLNMFFDREVYHLVVRNSDSACWDDTACHLSHKTGTKLIATLPSVIQHIGVCGVNCYPGYTDVAHDFL